MCATTAYKQASLNAIACTSGLARQALLERRLTPLRVADLKKLGYTLEQAYLLLSAAVRLSILPPSVLPLAP